MIFIIVSLRRFQRDPGILCRNFRHAFASGLPDFSVSRLKHCRILCASGRNGEIFAARGKCPILHLRLHLETAGCLSQLEKVYFKPLCSIFLIPYVISVKIRRLLQRLSALLPVFIRQDLCLDAFLRPWNLILRKNNFQAFAFCNCSGKCLFRLWKLPGNHSFPDIFPILVYQKIPHCSSRFRMVSFFSGFL